VTLRWHRAQRAGAASAGATCFGGLPAFTVAVLLVACSREGARGLAAARRDHGPAPAPVENGLAIERERIGGAAGDPSARARAADAPDLSRFNDEVRRHLRDRVAWHRRVLQTPGLAPDRRAQAHGELANLYQAYQLLEAAEPLYLEAQHLAPGELRWPHYLGYLYRSRNELEESAASYARALAIDPHFVPALVRLAEVEIDLDHAEQAAEHLRAAVAVDPRCAAAHFQIGRLAQARGDAAAAVESFARALELQPGASAIRRTLALALRDLGRLEEARREIAAAGDVTVSLSDPLMLALHRRSVLYWDQLAEGSRLLADGRLEPARHALEEAAAHDPLAAPPRLLLGELLAGEGSIVEARRQLELAVFLAETNPDAHRRLARLWVAQGDSERAIEAYRAAVAEAPGDGATSFELAQALRRAGRTEEAVAPARRAADLVTDHPMPLLFEATLAVELGRCGDATSRLEAGLAASPRQGAWAHALARILAACPDPAARDGRRALALARDLYAALPSPGHGAAVAKALAETGDLEGALRWQERAIALAREQGHHDLASALERDRVLYAAGAPSREPWRADELELFAAGAPSLR
jgi:tetratricopeptide (TPR) repeat protein